MTRIQLFPNRSLSLALALVSLTCVLTAQTTPRGGQPSSYGQVTVGTDIHHDVSMPLRDMVPAPAPTPPHKLQVDHPVPTGTRGLSSAARTSSGTKTSEATPELVNGSTGAGTMLDYFNLAGVGNYFNGPDGWFTPTGTPSDATGAAGTTQYLQAVDDSFAVFDKTTGTVLYGPIPVNNIFSGFGGPCETDSDGQPTVNFDSMANRWVVSQHAVPAGGPSYQCVAVSITDDATGDWNRYSFAIGFLNTTWENLNAKLGVWPDGYYMGFDMYAGSTLEGAKFCALNRSQMLLGASSGIQCIQLDPEFYSPIISDLDGATPPPAGTPAYFAADDVNFYDLDFWKFHVDWTDSQNTSLSLAILLPEPYYVNSCACIEQPSGMILNPNGSHVLGRLPYRNYGSYQSMLAVENAEVITTPVFYEVRVTSSGDLYMYQEGELQLTSPSYRFNPSIAEDRTGNIAVAYNSSNMNLWPSQYVSSRQLGDPLNTLGNETLLNPGNGSQTTPEWDARASLTVDPVDDCTFYYTQQYQPMDGTNNWSTQIESFTLAGCYAPLVLNTTPANLLVAASGSGQTISQQAPYNGQFPEGSSVSIAAPSPQSGTAGVQYAFASWSDGGTDTHTITMPSAGGTYTAAFTTQYELTPSVSPAGSGTVAPGAAAYYNSGSTVNLTATPAAGYVFTSWTGSVANSTSATTSITMNAPQAVTANFALLPPGPVLTTPTPGPNTVLGTTNVVFSWTPYTGVTEYDLYLGTTGAGSTNLYNSAGVTTTSVTVAKIPALGVTVYARLWYLIKGVWQHADYTYTESPIANPVLTSPTPGSVLGATNVVFSWTPGSGVTQYDLYLGTTGVGSDNLYNSAGVTTTSVTVPPLPSKGATVYARLYYQIKGEWQSTDYTYTEQ